MERQVTYQQCRFQNRNELFIEKKNLRVWHVRSYISNIVIKIKMDFSLKVTHRNRNRNEVINTHSFKQSQKNQKENYTKTEEKLKIQNSIETWPRGSVKTYPVTSHSI